MAIPSYSHSLQTERREQGMEKKEPRASDPPMEKQGDASELSSTVILVVDDDKMQRDILKTILSDEGYEAHGASSAEEALEDSANIKAGCCFDRSSLGQNGWHGTHETA